MNLILYGIPNCGTVKKARAWLAENSIDYAFHDYHKGGVDSARLRAWCMALGWEVVLNRAGSTFKKFSCPEKSDLTLDKAVELMAAAPSAIKRPVLEHPAGLLIGFKPDQWAAALNYDVSRLEFPARP